VLNKKETAVAAAYGRQCTPMGVGSHHKATPLIQRQEHNASAKFEVLPVVFVPTTLLARQPQLLQFILARSHMHELPIGN
jgi:hypothetical protein